MIRNLKILIAAAMALAAFGVFSASAQAAEELFHCAAATCRATLAPDETAGTATAHHVLVVKGKTAGGAEASTSYTCDQLTGEATASAKTVSELTFTNLKYENAAGVAKCKVGASETMEVNFTSCDYRVQAEDGSTSTAEIHVLCSTVGDGIDIIIKGTLCLQIKPFTSTGLGYRTLGTTPNRTVTSTATVSIPNAALVLKNVGNANCAALGLASTTGATYTTGNTITKAETLTGVSTEGWFE